MPCFRKEVVETVLPLQSGFFFFFLIPVSNIYHQEKKTESHTGSQGWGSKQPTSKTVQYQNAPVPKRPRGRNGSYQKRPTFMELFENN